MSTSPIKPSELVSYIDHCWESSIISALLAYICIPNKSPAFDAEWQQNGYMKQAFDLVSNWCKQLEVENMHLEVCQLPNRTPLLFIEIPGQREGTVLLYGHLDKQPEMTGWREGLAPWEPVIEGDKLYGRGGADDGYAIFSSLTAIKALQMQQIPHPRCVIIIEASEESGSPDLPSYIELLESRIGQPELVICLDSGCGNYEQLWSTSSLRGMMSGVLSVSLLEEGVHSGNASGIIASSFRVARQLLSRIEVEGTGELIPAIMHSAIPLERVAQAKLAAQILGDDTYRVFPIHEGVSPVSMNPEELILNRTWWPTLSIIGAEGLPSLEDAGNVLRPQTSFKLSFRLPPNADAEKASATLKTLLETDPPYGAVVHYCSDNAADGWDAPPLAPWLEKATQEASNHYFGASPVYMGEGGSIPFIGMLGKKYPNAQFLITGVLGPGANAHGPNEFLHLPTAKKLTACVAHIIIAL
ncbi:MAG: M20/M25/M40 family metallo-hydrolase [Legionellales bacterium]|nr:M20/M25/M40 family metallo-hydrolase [Legionellales bacterium]